MPQVRLVQRSRMHAGQKPAVAMSRMPAGLTRRQGFAFAQKHSHVTSVASHAPVSLFRYSLGPFISGLVLSPVPGLSGQEERGQSSLLVATLAAGSIGSNHHQSNDGSRLPSAPDARRLPFAPHALATAPR
ncbi:hypothetical protein E4U43_002152 [Claviceps pusilla]|uniref:Uncharacterized protein n=1 Tax=Claviceps pusilla TaxID=123648 RepID=A0A9P7N8R1_9HYPO|nr:hypothetical protein E4U43_002152 [Claviceps pusilla]